MTKRSLRDRMLDNPAVREHYEELGPEFALARELIAARAKAGLTQAEIAARMGTTQSTVARLESGKNKPSMDTLWRYADAIGSRVEIRIVNPKKRGKRQTQKRASSG